MKKKYGPVMDDPSDEPSLDEPPLDALPLGALDEPSKEKHRLWLFRFLSRKSHPEREVRDRLASRGVCPQEIEALILEFRDLHLLDDAAYARLFAEGHEGWGSHRVVLELCRRGLSREDIRLALEGRDEETQARTLAEGWLSEGVAARRVIGRLQRRGFSHRAIHSALRGNDETPW